MRVFKNDLLAVDVKGVRTIMVVRQLDAAARRFKLAPHNETGNLQARHDTDNEIDPFRWLIASYNVLKGMNAEPVRVDALGRVWRVNPKTGAR
jgi:CRISPR-associated endonuclease Csn1